MGNTLVEKLLMKNAMIDEIKPGDIITVNVDQVMVHDLFGPFVIEKFKEMGFEDVWDPEKITFIYDHLVPTSTFEDSKYHKIINQFAKSQGITKVHRNDGICHQLMPELGYVKPGDIVLGTDSHTTTYGAIGAFATGLGYTEMAAIFGTGKLWVKAPPTLRFNINGELPKGVYAKDIILKIIGDIGIDGANYKAMEFSGSTLKSLGISARLTISNMAVEAGAKVGLMETDEKTFEFSKIDKREYDYLICDDDANYENIYDYDASEFEPVVACPSNVDNVKNIREVKGTKINQAFLGSCTNGRLEDLEIAANIIRGKEVSPFVRFIVTPASQTIYKEACKRGILSDLTKAGAIINTPGCGLCCGRSGGIVSAGEKVISSNNRNFLGRMGDPKAEIYLASPATVTLAAIKGEIVDSREYV